jgi:hypothetical protein
MPQKPKDKGRKEDNIPDSWIEEAERMAAKEEVATKMKTWNSHASAFNGTTASNDTTASNRTSTGASNRASTWASNRTSTWASNRTSAGASSRTTNKNRYPAPKPPYRRSTTTGL